MKSKTKKHPKTVWFAAVNLSGVYDLTPVKAKQTYYSTWWSEDGNFLVEKLGLDVRDGCVKFASVDKDEVAAFITGARAVMHMLREWTDSSGFEDK